MSDVNIVPKQIGTILSDGINIFYIFYVIPSGLGLGTQLSCCVCCHHSLVEVVNRLSVVHLLVMPVLLSHRLCVYAESGRSLFPGSIEGCF
jgi:hypothetical protein